MSAPPRAEVHPAPPSPPAPGDVHVVFCADRAFMQHLAVAAVSLLENAGGARVILHVVSCDRDPETEARLAATVAPYPQARLRFHRADDRDIRLAIGDRPGAAALYLRLLIPRLLSGVARAVYLDCDLVVLGDIRELAAAPLAGKPLAAVAECGWSGPEVGRRLQALGLRPGHAYVNSGVLVMDLDRWRRDGLEQRVLAYIAHHAGPLPYPDQDALNAVLQDDIALLDLRWNLQPLALSRWARRALPEDHRAARIARRRPGIIHYTTERKPWKHRVWIRERALYFRYLQRTAWRGSRPALPTALDRLEYDAARGLLRLGIDIYAIPHAVKRLREWLGGSFAAGRSGPSAAPDAESGS